MTTRAALLKLQEAMMPMASEGVGETRHFFAEGLYLREMSVPAGTLVMGKTHRMEHFLIITKGRAIVVSEEGRQEIGAGYVSPSPAGAKRAILALEDLTMVTVHPNEDNTEDLEEIEEKYAIDDTPLLTKSEVRRLK